MRTYERNGVHVDQCTECRGIFLDRGELDRLIDAENAWHGGCAAATAPATPGGPRRDEPRRARPSGHQSVRPPAGRPPAAGLGGVVGEVLRQVQGSKSSSHTQSEYGHRSGRRSPSSATSSARPRSARPTVSRTSAPSAPAEMSTWSQSWRASHSPMPPRERSSPCAGPYPANGSSKPGPGRRSCRRCGPRPTHSRTLDRRPPWRRALEVISSTASRKSWMRSRGASTPASSAARAWRRPMNSATSSRQQPRRRRPPAARRARQSAEIVRGRSERRVVQPRPLGRRSASACAGRTSSSGLGQALGVEDAQPPERPPGERLVDDGLVALPLQPVPLGRPEVTSPTTRTAGRPSATRCSASCRNVVIAAGVRAR